MSKSELVLEGHVKIHSRSMTIIDPCYLKGSEIDYVDKTSQSKWLDLLNKRVEIEIKILLHTTLGKPVNMLEKKLANVISEMGKLKEEPSFSPPFVYQGKNYVLLRNGIGDGLYPIVQKPKRIHIVFNYPLKKSSLNLDEKILGNNIVGYSGVDSGMNCVIDSEKSAVEEDISKDIYCKIKVQNGDYACRFIENNGVLSIRRINL